MLYSKAYTRFLPCMPCESWDLASCAWLTGMGCAGQVGNPLLPGTKSKMLPDTDFTHQQYYEVGCARQCLLQSAVPCQLPYVLSLDAKVHAIPKTGSYRLAQLLRHRNRIPAVPASLWGLFWDCARSRLLGGQPLESADVVLSMTSRQPSYSVFPLMGPSACLKVFACAQLTLDAWPDGFAGLAFDNLISSSEHTGSGFELRDNVIMNNRGRGMLIKAGNGVMEGNTIIRPTFWPVQVSAQCPLSNGLGYWVT